MKTAAKKDAPVIVSGNNVYVMQAGMNIYLKTADVCSLLGCTNQWAGQLTAEGAINKSKTPHGSLYELFDNLSGYISRLKAKSDSFKADVAENEAKKIAAEARLKEAKAAQAELELAELQGIMHRSEDVQTFTEELIYAIRGAISALPGKLAVMLEGLTAAERSDVIAGEVGKVLNEIAGFEYSSKRYDERVRARQKREQNLTTDNDE